MFLVNKVKSFFQAKKQPTTLDNEFKQFEIFGDIYKISQDQQEKVFKQCKITFEEEVGSQWVYFLKCEGSNSISKINTYYFPINAEIILQSYQSKKGNKNLVLLFQNYEWNLDEKIKLRLMIDISSESDNIYSILFENYFLKLIYEVKNKKSYNSVKKDEEFQANLQIIEKPQYRKSNKQTNQQINDDVKQTIAKKLNQINSYQQQQQQQPELQIDNSQSLCEQFNNQLNISDNRLSQKKIQQKSQQEEINLSNPVILPNSLQSSTKQIDTTEIQQIKYIFSDQQISNAILELSQRQSSIFVASGEYFKLDDQNNLIPIIQQAIFVISSKAEYQFAFQIYSPDLSLTYEKDIPCELSYFIDVGKNWFKWINQSLDQNKNQLTLLLFRFSAFNTAQNLKFILNRCLYELKAKQSFEELFNKKKDEKENAEYQKRAFEINYEDTQDSFLLEEFKDSENLEFNNKYYTAKPQNYSDQQQQSINQYNQHDDLTFNRIISQAKIMDRSFATKGSIISVYRQEDEEEDQEILDFITNLPPLKSLKGDDLNPRKMILTQQDTKILLLNNDLEKQIYEMDLERGQIVREFQTDGVNKIADFCAEQKHGEMSGNQVFNCLNSKNMFKMDPRTAKGQVSEISIDKKIYSTNNEFTCITATSEGQIATGSQNGDIRLFTKIGQKAKNLYAGLGDPIINLDTSKDGRWLLATCKHYLLLLPTFGANAGDNGFKTTIKNKDKRLPYKLTLNPVDIFKYQVKDICFSTAKFDDSLKDRESYIISSTNNLMIIWSFNSILKGQLFDYQIKQFNDNVYSTEFKFNKNNKVFATLSDEFCLQQTAQRKKINNN